jgi:putative transposase
MYKTVDENKNTYAVDKLCKVQEVPRASYYRYRRRKHIVTVRQMKDLELELKIKQIFTESRCTYGLPRIKAELKVQGININKKKVYRLMKKQGISAVVRKKKPRPFIKDNSIISAPNLVNMNFNPGKRNLIWASDITYLSVIDRWHYLAIVMDLYSRLIIGWKADISQDESLVISSVDKALNKRINSKTDFRILDSNCKYVENQKGISKGNYEEPWDEKLIFHSDKGPQFKSKNLQLILQENQIDQSMSSKGNCYDNAVVESFFATLKKELLYRRTNWTKEELERELFEYIEIFYNRKRRHSSLGYMSPFEFETFNKQP